MEGSEITKKEIKEGMPFALLSYILFLWILTFIFEKDNRFAHFHAKQGMVIFIGDVICLYLLFIPVLGGLFRLILFILFILSLYGIYLALTGKCKKIYLIGDIADKLVA